jgi:hypothetical protein
MGDYLRISEVLLSKEIYAQKLSPNGSKITSEFLISSDTTYFKSIPTLHSIENGKLIVFAWSSQNKNPYFTVYESSCLSSDLIDLLEN